LCELNWREFGRPENLVGIRVADAAEKTRIGEGPFQGVIFGFKNARERFKIDEVARLIASLIFRLASPAVAVSVWKQFDTAGIEGVQSGCSGDDMKRSAPLRTGFRQTQQTVVEIK